MVAIAIVPAVACVVGALTYALSANAKAQEVGRGAYWVGLFWVLSALVGHTWRL